MIENNKAQKDLLETIDDHDIVTERKFPRRSFLSTGSALLAGVATAVAGARAAGQEDPNKRAEDTRKPEDRRKEEARLKEERRREEQRRREAARHRADDAHKAEDVRRADDPPRD